MMKVYISGPMTGIEDFNRPAFDEMERALYDAGADYVFNPAAQDRPEDWTWERHMQADLHELAGGGYSYIVMLDGWQRSTGATTERHLARVIGVQAVEGIGSFMAVTS